MSYKQPQELIVKICNAYTQARCLKHKPSDENRVLRGRSHTVSSETEDLFAVFFAENDSSITTVYVDQPISFKDNEKWKQKIPDIAIDRNGMIEAFVDIKMDLGWNRDGLLELCKKHFNTVDMMRGNTCRLKTGLTKSERELCLSEQLTYTVVIVSRKNSSKTLKRQLADIKVLEPVVEVIILCDRGHPNNYDLTGQELLGSLGINQSAFEQLERRLKG